MRWFPRRLCFWTALLLAALLAREHEVATSVLAKDEPVMREESRRGDLPAGREAGIAV